MFTGYNEKIKVTHEAASSIEGALFLPRIIVFETIRRGKIWSTVL